VVSWLSSRAAKPFFDPPSWPADFVVHRFEGIARLLIGRE
jgi:hypothetical protein